MRGRGGVHSRGVYTMGMGGGRGMPGSKRMIREVRLKGLEAIGGGG